MSSLVRAGALVLRRLLEGDGAVPLALPPPAFPAGGGISAQHVDGVPFVKGEGEANAVDPNDVRQGNLGDCWLLASMMAVAATAPDSIKDLIVARSDGRYDVTLFIATDPDPPSTAYRGNFRRVVVIVDSTFPAAPQTDVERKSDTLVTDVAHEDGEQTQPLFGRPKQELWPLLIERAYATYRGSYSAIEAGYGQTGLELLTGKGHTTYLTKDFVGRPAELLRILDALRRSGKPLVAGSKHGTEMDAATQARFTALRLEEQHAYALVSVDVGTSQVVLLNPQDPSCVPLFAPDPSHSPALGGDDLVACFQNIATIGE